MTCVSLPFPSALGKSLEVMSLPVSPKRSAQSAGLAIPEAAECSTSHLPSTIAIHNKIALPNFRQSSPISTLSSVPSADDNMQQLQDSDGAGPPTKKRKLTATEREVQRIEKECARQQREEAKVKREEERLKKAEEKRTREEEKEEKKKTREAERATKEEEKRKKQALREEVREKKEAEKRAKEELETKKARAQAKIGMFFTKNTTPTGGSATSSRRGSVTSYTDAEVNADIPQLNEQEKEKSAYHETFLPFNLPSYTTEAPYNRFLSSKSDFSIFSAAQSDHQQTHSAPSKLNDLFVAYSQSTRRRQNRVTLSVREIFDHLRGSTSKPIDLTSTSSGQTRMMALRAIPTKFLKFHEDLRPPYIGTYSKTPGGNHIRSLARNPFSRALPETNYDYDSEAEWDEGEDLNSENEDESDEEEEEEEEDMEGFIDDDEAEAPLRRHVMGDQQVVCTSLHWDNVGSTIRNKVVNYGSGSIDLNTYAIEPLLTEPQFPIDPFSTSYWTPARSDAMGPPRVPLNSLTAMTNVQIRASSPGGKPKAKAFKATAPAAKPVPAELMEEFKAAIDGSNLTKLGLVEVLKKQFSSLTGKTIQETLLKIAVREGKKEADKKWRLL